MEPATLLLDAIFGLHALAAYLTVALVRERPVFEGPESEHVPEEVPSLNTKVFCPEWRVRGEVAISLDRSGPKARLHVLSCDLLREGETCDLTCVGGIAQA